MMLVSVIVPVYNVKNYLNYAFESLLNQSYQNIEIILVNDGSTDGSDVLCQKYADQYANIFLHNKKNGGLSDARNYGLKYANGDWITFLDPDDYLDSQAIEYMVEIQKKYQADLVSTKVKIVHDYQKYNNDTLFPITEENIQLYSKEDALKVMLEDKIATVSACGKLYKKDILKKNPFPVGKLYEDLYIMVDILNSCKNIYISNRESYYYYQRQGSIVNSKFKKNQYDFFEALEYNKKKIIQKYSNKQSLLESVSVKLIRSGFRIVDKAIECNELNDVYILRDIFKLDSEVYIHSNQVKYKSKIKLVIFIMTPRVYQYMYKLKKR